MVETTPKIEDRTLEEQASDCVAEARAFIKANSEYFGVPICAISSRDSKTFEPIAEEAKALMARLNFLGNELNIRGGHVGLIIKEISDLFNHLNIILSDEGFYSSGRLLINGPHRQIIRISGSKKLEVYAVLAMEKRYGKATIRENNHPGLRINEAVPITAFRQTKLYQALHITFTLRGKVDRALIDNPELGWMLLNLDNQALNEQMDTGHALGRVWEMNEMQAIARDAFQTYRPEDGTSSITLISNLRSNGNGFSQDQLQLQRRPIQATKDSVTQALTRVCVPMIQALRRDQHATKNPIRGGATGLRPLAKIFER